MKTVSKIRGGILGALVGDALGVPYEFEFRMKPNDVVWKGFGTHQQPPGTWSDDGALLLCAVDSLSEKGHFDENHLATKFLLWQAKGHMACGQKLFDIGNATVKALYRLRNGVPPLEAGLRDKYSCGNGSLMRILPHALFQPLGNSERLVEIAHSSSAITHGHPLCQVACALYCLLAQELLEERDKEEALSESVEKLKKYYRNYKEKNQHEEELNRLLSHNPLLGSGFVADSFHSSWLAFLETSSFEEALKRAVSFGQDTDTVASITGGLAGVYYGEEAIPKEWRESLRIEEEHERVMRRFLKRLGL